MKLSISAALFASTLVACGAPHSNAELGELSLALSTQAGGETYRLTKGEFALKGPSPQAFSVKGDDPITLDLPIGSYTLSLAEGWVLSHIDEDGGKETAVVASLESANPAPIVVGPGATTEVTLRFALADGSSVDMATGTLQVGVSVGASGDDGGTVVGDACTSGLIINEIDYEQSGADTAEFVEILNTAGCAAKLAEVSLELVNGGDGKVYGRTTLSLSGAELAAGARLVVGHPNVLAMLPASVMRAQLGSGGLQNGAPDAVRLVAAGSTIDAFSYEGAVAGAAEGSGAMTDEGDGSFSRCPDGFDSQDNSVDFRLVPVTPGDVNACADSK